MVNLIAAIKEVTAEQDSSNSATDEIPPVLPHMLVKMHGRDFARIIWEQRSHLLLGPWTETTIEQIEHEFQQLQSAYLSEPNLKRVLDECDNMT